MNILAYLLIVVGSILFAMIGYDEARRDQVADRYAE